MVLITDPDNIRQGSEITINTGLRTFTLTTAGSPNNLTNDGVTLQALYSFFKEEWKDDATLIPHPFPMSAITPEQFEFLNDWEPADDTTRKLIRTGGWRELDNASVLKREYAGVITLGNFEDNDNDLAYYWQGTDVTDTTATVNFDFAGPVNEAVLTFHELTGPDAGSPSFDFVDGGGGNDQIVRSDGGSWITDGYRLGGQVTVRNAAVTANNGTYEILAITATTLDIATASLTADSGDTAAVFAKNFRNNFKIFIRIRDADPNGKTFQSSDLPAIGITGAAGMANNVYRFPLSNATDLNISASDASITGGPPWDEIFIRYFDQAFTRTVDISRNFGIVIDVGTFSLVDGATTASDTVVTTAEAGIPVTTYDGGTLIIHEGADAGSYTISTATGGTITLADSPGLTATASNISMTLQRSTPIVASLQQIYEKVQWSLRQQSDIDATDQIVTGNTADNLLVFVGSNLQTGQSIPSNPNGGGSGVIIEGFDSNDTNDLTFTDNAGTNTITFPFVAAGTLNFNQLLVDDTGPAEYTMFFTYTERFTSTGWSITNQGGSPATVTIQSTDVDLVNEVTAGDFIKFTGWSNAINDGVYQVLSTPTGSPEQTLEAQRINLDEPVDEVAGASVSMDKNPIDSDDAIIVDDNGGADVAGTIGGLQIAFDYDYDGNVQGGRTAGTDAAITIRAIGLDAAQFVEVTGTITRATGLSFTITAGQERNYSNP
jgi:hypothetical protein